MVNTEILPRCSRVISASSDTTHLHFSTRRCALVYLFRSAYNMTCSLQVMLPDTSRSNDRHHFKRQGGLHQSRGASSGPSARHAPLSDPSRVRRPLFPEIRQTPADQLIGSRTFLRQQILRSDALPGLLVDHCKFHRVSGSSIDKFERRPGVSRNRPLVSHLRERLNHENDVPALRRQKIFVPLGIELVSAPLDQL